MCIRERWRTYQSFTSPVFHRQDRLGFCRFSGQSCWFCLYGRMLQMAFWFGKILHLLQEIKVSLCDGYKGYMAGFVVFVFNSFQV